MNISLDLGIYFIIVGLLAVLVFTRVYGEFREMHIINKWNKLLKWLIILSFGIFLAYSFYIAVIA